MQRSFFAVARRQQMFLAVAGALIVGALIVAVVPGSAEILTGIRRTPRLASPDDLPALSSDAPNFFDGRDQIRIRITERTTLRRFLDRNRLNKPYHRQQIVEQLGSAMPDAPIADGTVFKIRLTPTTTDVPGTSTAAAEVRQR